jgi:hypothetical protein
MRMTVAAAAKGSLRGLCLAMVTILGAGDAMAIEEAPYTVVTTDGAFEIRDCAPTWLSRPGAGIWRGDPRRQCYVRSRSQRFRVSALPTEERSTSEATVSG